VQAPVADQLLLLEVQAADSHVDALLRRARTLPQLARIAAYEAELAALAEPGAAAEQAVVELGRAQQAAEGAVAAVRSRLDRDRSRLDSGLGSAKDMQALSSGVQAELKRIGELEDAELEVMEALEEAVGTRDALSARRAAISAELAREQTGRDAELAAIDGEVAGARAARDALAAGVDPTLLTLYGRVRASSGGVGAAALRANRCLGCSLELNPAELARLAASPPTEVERCEECDRILIRP
jgi:predicted  nucleic acid-binding Zn-ribbon protein